MDQDKLFGNLFLGVGAMKAGTTWLYSVLDQHPNLHFTPEKEIHYFYHRYVDSNLLNERKRLHMARERYLLRFDPDHANIDRIRMNLHWVAAYLSHPVDDFWYRSLFQTRAHHAYACDFSNLNAHLPVAAWRQIARQCTKLRVLFTMRDPLKRLWSHTKFHLQITGQADNLTKWGPRDYTDFVRQPFIWQNAEYGRVLRTLRAGLDRETWRATFYETLHEDQITALREIESFLALPPHSYPEKILDRHPTQSVTHPMPPFFAEIFEKDITRIKSEICAEGFDLPPQWG